VGNPVSVRIRSPAPNQGGVMPICAMTGDGERRKVRRAERESIRSYYKGLYLVLYPKARMPKTEKQWTKIIKKFETPVN
jgi:hypothetical protein